MEFAVICNGGQAMCVANFTSMIGFTRENQIGFSGVAKLHTVLYEALTKSAPETPYSCLLPWLSRGNSHGEHEFRVV